MTLTPSDQRKLIPALSGVVRLLMQIVQGGAENLTLGQIHELKGVARGLARIRLRRLSSRLMEFSCHAEAHLRHELGSDSDLSLLLTDCVQSAKFIKTYLKGVSARPEVLEEVFECRWTEADQALLTNRILVEMSVVSEFDEKANRLDSRYFIDTLSGEVFVSRTVHSHPQSEETLPPQPTTRPIRLLVGRVFPGFSPRELRIVDDSECEEDLGETGLKGLMDVAHSSISKLASRFARERRNYFAPSSSHELVRIHCLAALREEIYAADSTGDLLRIDRSGNPRGVRCIRLAERARPEAIFGRVFRDQQGRLTISPLAVIAHLQGLELVRL